MPVLDTKLRNNAWSIVAPSDTAIDQNTTLKVIGFASNGRWQTEEYTFDAQKNPHRVGGGTPEDNVVDLRGYLVENCYSIDVDIRDDR